MILTSPSNWNSKSVKYWVVISLVITDKQRDRADYSKITGKDLIIPTDYVRNNRGDGYAIPRLYKTVKNIYVCVYVTVNLRNHWLREIPNNNLRNHWLREIPSNFA